MYQEKMTPRFLNIQKSALIVLLIAILLVIISVIARNNAIQSANSAEIDMNTQFAKCLRSLGSYYTNAENSLGIAKENDAQLVKIINAVSTRSSTAYGQLPLSDAHNQVYIDLQRAYPDLRDSTDFYKNAEALMVGDFENYNANGNVMSEMIGVFQKQQYGTFGFLLSGYPNDILTAQPDASKPAYHGQAALEEMQKVITNQNVGTSYNQGHTQSIFP